MQVLLLLSFGYFRVTFQCFSDCDAEQDCCSSVSMSSVIGYICGMEQNKLASTEKRTPF